MENSSTTVWHRSQSTRSSRICDGPARRVRRASWRMTSLASKIYVSFSSFSLSSYAGRPCTYQLTLCRWALSPARGARPLRCLCPSVPRGMDASSGFGAPRARYKAFITSFVYLAPTVTV